MDGTRHMSAPTDAYQYPVTVNGMTFIYHSPTPLTPEELASETETP